MFLSNTAQWMNILFLQQVNEYATLKYLMYNAIVYKLEPGRGWTQNNVLFLEVFTYYDSIPLTFNPLKMG